MDSEVGTVQQFYVLDRLFPFSSVRTCVRLNWLPESFGSRAKINRLIVIDFN